MKQHCKKSRLSTNADLDLFFAKAPELVSNPAGDFFQTPFVCDYEILTHHPTVYRSPELDYGVHWHLYDENTKTIFLFPAFRVSWIEKTGILYAVGFYPEKKISYLLGYFPDRASVEEAMKGWSNVGATIKNIQLMQGCPDGYRNVNGPRL